MTPEEFSDKLDQLRHEMLGQVNKQLSFAQCMELIGRAEFFAFTMKLSFCEMVKEINEGGGWEK